ncbi:MAG TPA: DUF126 domain-containing protein [Methanothermobacter sp.]|nr:DUF126 domain-containing protein [Methanothermobacter sp.]
MAVKKYIMKCRKVVEGKVSGEAIVTREAINFYQVNPETGTIIEEGHELNGEKIGGKILVFPGDKGSSVVQLDGLFQMAQKGNKPKGMIVKNLSTVLVSNAIIMEIPLVDSVDEEFYRVISNGDWVEIDTDKEVLIIVKK